MLTILIFFKRWPQRPKSAAHLWRVYCPKTVTKLLVKTGLWGFKKHCHSLESRYGLLKLHAREVISQPHLDSTQLHPKVFHPRLIILHLMEKIPQIWIIPWAQNLQFTTDKVKPKENFQNVVQPFFFRKTWWSNMGTTAIMASSSHSFYRTKTTIPSLL